MDTLVLKLSLTPLLILAISLASRRWGEAVGGWLVGLPITSGPVVLFLALDHGTPFAEQAAAGALAGTVAQACFCLAFFQAVGLARWPVAFVCASLAFAAAAASLKFAALWPLPLYALALGVLSVSLRLSPRSAGRARAAILPLWDMPARMLVATALVLAITSLATRLGPGLSGMLSTFPVFATVLTVFAHRSLGAPAARQVLRGLMLGLYCFSTFFVVLSLAMPRASLAAAFGAATATALAVHGFAFRVIRKQGRPATAGKPPKLG